MTESLRDGLAKVICCPNGCEAAHAPYDPCLGQVSICQANSYAASADAAIAYIAEHGYYLGKLREAADAEQDADKCWCWRCTRESSRFATRMILCPTCGNKRCPKASDHRLSCTGSNEPGQEGSVY